MLPHPFSHDYRIVVPVLQFMYDADSEADLLGQKPDLHIIDTALSQFVYNHFHLGAMDLRFMGNPAFLSLLVLLIKKNS